MLELRYKRILGYERVLSYDLGDLTSKGRVPTCELVRECGKDVLEFLSIEVIPRAEKAGTEGLVPRDHVCERLRNGRLPRSGQPIEPEDVFVLWILGPLHYLIEDGLSSTPEARVMMTSLVACATYRIQLVQ